MSWLAALGLRPKAPAHNSAADGDKLLLISSCFVEGSFWVVKPSTSVQDSRWVVCNAAATATRSCSITAEAPSVRKCMPPSWPKTRVNRKATNKFGKVALGMGAFTELLQVLPLPASRWGAIICESSQYLLCPLATFGAPQQGR